MKNRTKKKARQAVKIQALKIPNPQRERDIAELRIFRWENLKKSIAYLQDAVLAKFGKKADTRDGAATLYIAHDRVELVDQHNTIKAEDAVEVAATLF